MKLRERIGKWFSSPQQFMAGALILAAAGIICRLLGLLFRIPLVNIVGNFGMGLYQMVFPLYALLLIVSGAGIPIAISKMIAKEKLKGNHAECRRILYNSIFLLAIIGLVFSALFMVFSHHIAAFQGNAGVGKIYLAIAPSVFLVCIICAFRGYFQGLQNMVPTATSQVIEQLAKVAFGIVLALALATISIEWAVFGAILAVTISEIFALVFLIFLYLKNRKKSADEPIEGEIKKGLSWSLIWQILKTSLPITLMASVFPLILVFDSLVVVRLLQSNGVDNQVATQLFGISSGTVHTLINMPAVMGVAIATAVVPTVATLLKQEKLSELRTKCAFAIKLIFLISLFFTIFYITFARGIIHLLYSGAFEDNPDQATTASVLLKIEAGMLLLMGISQVFAAILQGAGKAKFPLIAIAVGGAAKVAFQLIFIPTFMGIYAVSIANVICFTLAMALNTIFALRVIKIKATLRKIWWRSIVLAVFATALMIGLSFVFPHTKPWLLLASTIAFGLYLLAVWLLRLFGKDDIRIFKEMREAKKHQSHQPAPE